jgi:hypothetical protein
MRDIVARHAGDIYVLGESGNIAASLQIVERFYGLAPVDRPCLEVTTRHETDVVYLCPVVKAAPSAPPP